MRFDGVVFDLDHTLFDRYATIRELTPMFCQIFADKISKDLDTESVANLLIESDSKFIYHGWKRIFDELCEKGLFSLPLPTYERYRDCLLLLFQCYAVAFPFTHTVLSEIKSKGIKLGLITNGKGYIQRRKLELLGIEGYFDHIIVCGEFGVQKPDRAPFYHMAKVLDIPAEKLLFVGDNPICDVDASRNAGYTPVEILTAQCKMPDVKPAQLQLKTVEELPALIDRLQCSL